MPTPSKGADTLGPRTSVAREFERRRSNRESRTREDHPWIDGLRDEPHHLARDRDIGRDRERSRQLRGECRQTLGPPGKRARPALPARSAAAPWRRRSPKALL